MGKNWKELLSDYELTKSEVEEAISNGILSKDIYSLVTYLGNDGYYHERILNHSYYKSVGIKYYFEDWFSKENKDMFFVTDFHLIYCESKLYDSTYIGKEKKKVYKGPDKIKIIPLENIEYIKWVHYVDFSTSPTRISKTVEKNPVVGAVVGAAVAGAPGAIVGSAINSGTKTKTSYVGAYSDNVAYELKIQLLNAEECATHIERKFDKSFYTDDRINEIVENENNEIEKLIERANSEYSIEEKSVIVNQTIANGEEEYENHKKQTNKDNAMAMAFIIVPFIILGIIKLLLENS